MTDESQTPDPAADVVDLDEKSMVDQLENSAVESLVQLDEPRLRWNQWQTQVLSHWQTSLV